MADLFHAYAEKSYERRQGRSKELMDSQHSDDAKQRGLEESHSTVRIALEAINSVTATLDLILDPSRQQTVSDLMEQEKAAKKEDIKSLESEISQLKRDRDRRIKEEAKIRRDQETFIEHARSCKPKLEDGMRQLDQTITSLNLLSTTYRFCGTVKKCLEAYRKYIGEVNLWVDGLREEDWDLEE
jgi:chromosome segregation ATPase